VLSGTAAVSLNKQHQVQAAIAELDYNPSDLTRAIFTGRANSVGVLVADLRNPYYTDLMRGVESVVTSAGALAFLASGARDHDREASIMRSMDSQRVRGLVITVSGAHKRAIQSMAGRGTECVFVTRPRIVRHQRVHSVRVDDHAVGAMAWRRMRQNGRRNVVVVTQSLAQYTQRTRLEGYRSAAAADGFEVPDDHVIELGTPDEPTDRLLEVLRHRVGRRRVDGVFAVTGIATLRAYQQLYALGLKLPDDVAFIGFDDFPWAPYVATPLTLIGQPGFEMGVRAAQLILEEPGRGREIVMPPFLVERSSG
jgi:LacI family transcriptional regulator